MLQLLNHLSYNNIKVCYYALTEHNRPTRWISGSISIMEYYYLCEIWKPINALYNNSMCTVQKGTVYTCWTVAAQSSTNCTCPPQWGPVSTIFWAGRPSGPAGWLALLLLKAGDVETNPGPKHTCTQVWICDICHREINRKQTSLRCNHSEHWVHLRCSHIRIDQYQDTWICYLYRGSRLPHASHTSPHFPMASSRPLLHSPSTPPHPKHQHASNSPTSPPKMTNPKLPKPLIYFAPTPPTPTPA